MGFLDKFFGRKEKEELPLGLNIEDLERWTAGKIEARKSEACEVMLPKVNEVLEARERASEIIEELQEHDFPEEIKRRMYKPVLTSKPLYVRGISEGLQDIEFKKPCSFERLVEFHKVTLNALKIIQNVQISQGRYLAEVFRDEVLKLGGALNKIIDLTKEMGDLIVEEGKAVTLLQDLGSRGAELHIKIKEIQKSKEKIVELEREISKLKAEIEALKKESVEFESSKAFREHLRLMQLAEENKKQKAALNSKALNLLGPLARVFRKYRKIAGKKAGLEDPLAALFSEQDYAALLKEIKKAVESGAVSLDAKEKERTLQKLEEATARGGELKDEYEKIIREEALLESKLSSSSAPKRKEEIEAEIKAYEKKLGELNGEMRSTESSARELERKMLEMKGTIQEELSKVEGREVRIAARD